MTDATVWEGQSTNIPVVNTDGNIMEEWQTATANQTVFNLVSFEYTPGTNSLFVFKSGLILHRDVDYTETDKNTVTLTTGVPVNTQLTFLAIAIAQAEAPLFEHGVPAGGTTGQYLAKATGSDYDVEWISPPATPASLQDGPRASVASAATVNLVALEDTTRNILITGTTTIGGFQISDGQLWAVKFAAALTLTNSASLVTQTGADVKVVPNSTCFIRATADNQVEVLAMTKAFDIGGPAFDAYASGAQTVNNTSDYKVLLATEAYDTNANFASSTFTPTVPGYYHFEGNVTIIAAGAGGGISAKLWKNGAQVKIGSSGYCHSAGDFSSHVSAEIYMNGTTDYVELYAYQDTGGVRSIRNTAPATYFSAFLARPA